MTVHVSTVTTKGETTVPAPIREALGLEVGKSLVWELSEDAEGKQSLAVHRGPDIDELAGSLSSEVPFVGIEEEKQAAQKSRVANAVSREQRSLRR